MFHRLLSTDGPGSECIVCGAAFDGEGAALDAIESMVPCRMVLMGGTDQHPHHWIAEGRPEGMTAACHYCPAVVTPQTLPADVTPVCPGER